MPTEKDTTKGKKMKNSKNKVAVAPGNTIPAPCDKKEYSVRARRIQITNHDTENINEILKYFLNKRKKSLQYLIASEEECPTTGKKHNHIFICFNTSSTIKSNKIFNAHIETCKGSVKDNINYITKTEKYSEQNINTTIIAEYGTPPRDSKMTAAEIKEIKTTEELYDINPHLFNINLKLQQIQKRNMKLEDFEGTYKPDIQIVYIDGPSGSGKTKRAREIIKEQYKEDDIINSIQFNGQFYQGVTEEGTIYLYDEFRDNHMKLDEFIKLIDYNKHILNVKGGEVQNNSRLIIITSIKPLSLLYDQARESIKMQFKRRITKHITYYKEGQIFTYNEMF